MSKNRKPNGQFAPGNKLGQGKPLSYPTPESLEKACLDYFEWAEDTPWIKKDAVRGGENAGMLVEIPLERPFTLTALCQHLGITRTTWGDYEKRDGYSNICTYIREKIDNQQLEGAMVGCFNASITARRLGLTDKKVIEGGDEDKPVSMVTKVIFENYAKDKGE